MMRSIDGRNALAASGIAALLASGCCLGPLVLVTLGFSGAWIGNLSALEPYRPWLIGAAVLTLSLAWYPIFRPPQACRAGKTCAAPRRRMVYKLIFCFVTLLVAVAIGFPYVLPLFY